MTINLPSADLSGMRQAMVDSQLKTVGVSDTAVLAAMGSVPREDFVEHAAMAYADAAQPVAPGRWLLEPMALALLLANSAVEPGQAVLVVGSATGYSAAVLAHMGACVTALESDAALATRAPVETKVGPLTAGWPQAAPYDLILFEGAIEQVPPAIVAQLAPGGRIAAVIRSGGVGRAYAGPLLDDGRIAGLPFLEVAAAPLPGFGAPKAFAF
jgi:protein-L-isoaspartate(D-aspartate) O-methyltransferase